VRERGLGVDLVVISKHTTPRRPGAKALRRPPGGSEERSMQDAGYELPRTPAFHALRCIAFSLRCSGSIYTLGTQAMGPAFRS
jgi:hypothetical protein